jgi:GNAT superfamily N-acetyltransferase
MIILPKVRKQFYICSQIGSEDNIKPYELRRICWQSGETPVEKQLIELCTKTFPEEPWELYEYSDPQIVKAILAQDLGKEGSACFGFFNAKGRLIAACWTFPISPHGLKQELRKEQGVRKLPMGIASKLYGKDVCYLAGILTDKDHRGNGLAARMLRSCLDHCRAVGSDIFLLYTYSASAMPRRFMDENHFKQLETSIPNRPELVFYVANTKK